MRDPEIGSDSIHYAIEVLKGTVPPSSGACTRFIDPLGRPLSPVSVAGMRLLDRGR